jgi:hypothetical protein
MLNGIVSLVVAGAACNGITAMPLGEEDGRTADGSAKIPPPYPDEPSFTCTAPLEGILTNLKPATPVDYVELRDQEFDQQTREPARGDGGAPDADAGDDAGVLPGPLLPTKTGASNGTACATASNRSACLEALAEARIAAGAGWATEFGGGLMAPEPTFTRRFLVFTRGDEVGIVGTRAEVATFLGPIDTLEEARLLVTTGNRDLTCTTDPFKSGWRQNADGSWELLIAYSDCGTYYRLRLKVTPDGMVTEIDRQREESGSVCGRRPDGLVPTGTGGAACSMAACLAEAAHLEAASVLAFRRLERELRALGAPRDLIARARRSRADEIRHAREMAALAQRFGAVAPPVEVAPEALRTPFDVALENAVEGCVRETYGALVATYQARTASDPELRSVLGRIARDEARHAELAHDVARWLEPKLDAAARAKIAESRAAALADLRAALLVPPAPDVARLAGMPRPREAHALLDALEIDVLSAA